MSGACRPVADWPKLLLGPMVRRVTSGAAHVFIATSVECGASLALRPGRHAHSAIDDDDFADAVALDRIGERLWVGLLQVALPAGSAGETYSYDVKLDTAAESLRLDDLGELGNVPGPLPDIVRKDVPLGYATGMLPSFVVPPVDTADLRLAQASCRKPAGGSPGEPDALAIVDEVISLSLPPGESEPEPPPSTIAAAREDDWAAEAPPPENRERPHQLILTGDQIYADDVPASLLAALSEAGEALMGWTEMLPGVVANWNEFMTQPGWRTRFLALQELVEVPAIGDTDFSANHLLHFGEWCAMYLFAWSDALWARTGDRLGVDLLESQDQLPIDEVAQRLEEPLKEEAPGLPGYFITFTPPQFQILFALLTALDEFGRQLKDDWDASRDPALHYGASVRNVRRLLANVATYTMFDDHEITDDWYLNRHQADLWRGVTDDGPAEGWTAEIGPRLLRNGLSAYAIFQHWGNEPADFGARGPGQPRNEETHGARLLGMWRGSTAAPPTLCGPPIPVGQPADPVTRSADTLLAIDRQPSPVPAPGTPRAQFPRMRFDYWVDFGSHKLIALDTRTWRFFPDEEPFAWPRELDRAELTPENTATLEYLDATAAAWEQAAASAGSVPLFALAEVLRECHSAAHATNAQTTEPHLLAAAVALDALAAPPLWTPEGSAAARAEIEVLRGFLEPGDADQSGDFTREDQLWQGAVMLRAVAAVPTDPGAERDPSPVPYTLAALARVLESAATGTSRSLGASVRSVLGGASADLLTVFTDAGGAHAIVAAAIDQYGPMAEAFLDMLVPDGLSEWFFRDGSKHLAAALIDEDALEFQLTDPIHEGNGADEERPVVLLSPAPIFGSPLVEAVQRGALVVDTLRGRAATTVHEYEPWSGNTPGLNALFLAARALPRCVVLSGDVHYANSSVNDVELLADGVATRYVQLTSSASRNANFKSHTLGWMEDSVWDSRAGLAVAKSLNLEMAQMSLDKAAQPDAESETELALHLWAFEHYGVETGEEIFSLENFGNWLIAWIDEHAMTAWEFIEWQFMAPYNTGAAWFAEARYLTWSAVNFILEFWDDPLAKMFGEYLYAPDVLRQQLVDFYHAYGVDPSIGHQVRRTLLRDLRPVRRDLYRARERYVDKGRQVTGYANKQEIQTVGSNNVGLIRFYGDAAGAVIGVRHELLFYPMPEPESKPGLHFPDPAGLVHGVELPRTDWMGTVHECSWNAYSHELALPGTE